MNINLTFEYHLIIDLIMNLYGLNRIVNYCTDKKVLQY